MNEQQNMAMGSGLSRYRSAPSSYFASLLEGPNTGDRGFGSDDFERLFNPRAISPETQRIFSSFMNSGQNIQHPSSSSGDTVVPKHSNIQRLAPPNTSPLIRHSSSPAGLFANINIDEFGTVRGLGNFGDGNIANAEASFCSTSRFKMDPITEIETDDFHRRLDDQKNEGGTPRLSHHLSLPKSSAELSSMLQDSVPCKFRAKRGCATHPRSIAERVRRTKISERMRKLQELVPNMEKQTNTSDMLDLAVEYIKDLQGQVKTLCDDREKCSCEAKLGS
ncbi:hypothetical protein ACS0TY_005406 [Phlomoides rotata]